MSGKIQNASPMVKAILIIIFSIFFFLFDLAFGYSIRVDYNEPIPKPIRSIDFSETIIDSTVYVTLDNSIERFIRQWGVTGASVAVAKDGKLVYAKGFGYANRENDEPMQPNNLLRVASVSKLITAVAVMKLVEDGRLNLESTVFGPNGILNVPTYNTYIDERVTEIKVKHLLNHSAGWTTRWGDHLFMHGSIARQLNKELPLTQDDIICFALAKRLHFKPGTRSSYNNLGYIILEKVIEKTTALPYEMYVKNSVLRPIGIYDAFIAHNFDSLRYPLETRYYEVPEAEKVPAFNGQPKMVLKSRGGNDIRALGAAGGWVISSVSLMKFLLAIEPKSDVKYLSSKSLIELTQAEPGIHPLGWRWVSTDGTKWRTGSFAGTSALAISRNDGFSYVFLTNTSPWVGARFPYEVNRMMTNAIQRIEVWPNINLFNTYTRSLTYVEREEYPEQKNIWDLEWEFTQIFRVA
jgi:CubicO group peptidase (beta-lactamase class C family)